MSREQEELLSYLVQKKKDCDLLKQSNYDAYVYCFDKAQDRIRELRARMGLRKPKKTTKKHKKHKSNKK